jgi:hypothetical protein
LHFAIIMVDLETDFFLSEHMIDVFLITKRKTDMKERMKIIDSCNFF